MSVPSRHLSRRHFELRLGGGELTLCDLGSRNGVSVNGQAVARATLRPGAIIDAGGIRFAVLPPARSELDLPEFDGLAGMVGASVAMRRLYRDVLGAARGNATVLIRGESGSGKEMVAAALHTLSCRCSGRMVICDLASIRDGTFDTELFGQTRGAFTGAVRDTLGLVRTAHGGTLLLDEVGELSPEGQAKVLRLVERHEVRPVGSTDVHRVDIRLVASTLRPLEEMVAARRFRLDLLHRLSVVVVTVPPLRERLEDLPLLVPHLIAQLAPGQRWELTEDAEALLAAYTWPGNVRELSNLLQRVLMRAAPPVLDLDALVHHGGLTGTHAAGEAGPIPFHAAKELVTDRWERAYLAQLLRRAQGNFARAADLSGLSRMHVYRLVKKHRIEGV